MKKNKLFMYALILIVSIFTLNISVKADVANTITADMSQDEIDAITIQGGVINVLPGDYQYKIVRSTKDDTTIVLAGDYTKLRIITEANSNVTLNANTVLDGQYTSGQSGAPVGIFVRSGSTLVNANKYTLTITDYTGGMRLGVHSNVVGRSSASLNIASGNVIIQNSVARGETSDDGSAVGSAATGTGIFIYGETETVKNQLSVTNANLTIKNLANGAAIYRLNYDTKDEAHTTGSSTMIFSNATVTIENCKSGYSAISDEGFSYNNVTFLIEKSNLYLLNNSKNGYTGANSNRRIKIIDSNVVANGNASAGMKFDCQGIDIINSYLYAEGNGSFGFTGMTNANVNNSTIETVDNKLAGMVFYGNSIVSNNSKLISYKDGERTYSTSRSSAAAARIYPGTLTIIDSVTNFDSVSGISFYNTSGGNVRLYVTGTTVAAITSDEEFNSSAGELYDDWNASEQNTGRTIVISGSLQAEFDNMTTAEALKELKENVLNPVITFENGEKELTQYLAPVNSDGTALTRFDLNSEINKEVGGEGIHTFVYYDPNTGKEYTYTFRYNELGEDLIEGESGNAYVWTPVSVVDYDATEGVVDYEGSTAGEVIIGSSKTDQTNNGTSDRYTSDITIFGNSLDLAEKVMPKAYKEGYVFLGWFVPKYEDTELAAYYASIGNFEELYKLLVIPFYQNTKVLSDFNDVTTGIEEITLYAKFIKEGNVIAKYVDTDGNELLESVVTIGIVGDEYQTTAKDIEGYKLIEVVGKETGTYVDGTIYVIYYYDKNVGTGDIEPPKTGVNVYNVTNLVVNGPILYKKEEDEE